MSISNRLTYFPSEFEYSYAGIRSDAKAKGMEFTQEGGNHGNKSLTFGIKKKS
jgi:hypothetical protein